MLKPGGRFCITDLRRDVNPLIKRMIYNSTQPKEIRPGFLSSLNAAYTAEELRSLLEKSPLNSGVIHKEFFGLCLAGQKAV